MRLKAAKVLKSTVVGKPFQAFMTCSQKKDYDYVVKLLYFASNTLSDVCESNIGPLWHRRLCELFSVEKLVYLFVLILIIVVFIMTMFMVLSSCHRLCKILLVLNLIIIRNNNHDDILSAVIMAEPLREFTQ